MELTLVKFGGKTEGALSVSDAIFKMEVRKDILQRVVCWQRARYQQGTHKTKTISEISGTTKKPFAQKGTGRARQGSLRAPQFRGGATVFGPVVRDHSFKLPKKVRAKGLCMALSSKAGENQLFVMKDMKFDSQKTKDFLKAVAHLDLTSCLFIDHDRNDTLRTALSNVKKVDFLPVAGANVYDILHHKTLIMSESAVKLLEERLAC